MGRRTGQRTKPRTSYRARQMTRRRVGGGRGVKWGEGKYEKNRVEEKAEDTVRVRWKI